MSPVWLLRLGEHSRKPLEHALGAFQLGRSEAFADRVRPVALRILDLAQDLPAPRCELRQLGAFVARVLGVADEPVALEVVGDPLDALACEAPGTCDLCDRQRLLLDRSEHTPAGGRLPRRLREPVA